jgi:hypothetical protein
MIFALFVCSAVSAYSAVIFLSSYGTKGEEQFRFPALLPADKS